MSKTLEIIYKSLEIRPNEFSPTDRLLLCPTWDSIGQLSLIANIKEIYNIEITLKKISSLLTFFDLESYINDLVKHENLY